MTYRFFKYILLVTAFLLFTLTSCKEENTEDPFVTEAKKKLPNNNIIKSDNIDSLLEVKQEEYLAGLEEKEKKSATYDQIVKEKNLSKDVLDSFLPKKISGFIEIPASGGRRIEDDEAITTFARKQFRDTSKKVLIFDIFDYGKGNPVMNAHIYDSVPDDLDEPAYPVKLPNAKGYYYWLEGKRYGHIEVLADNRFVIIVRINGFERDDNILFDYLKLININSIIKSGKK